MKEENLKEDYFKEVLIPFSADGGKTFKDFKKEIVAPEPSQTRPSKSVLVYRELARPTHPSHMNLRAGSNANTRIQTRTAINVTAVLIMKEKMIHLE